MLIYILLLALYVRIIADVQEVFEQIEGSCWHSIRSNEAMCAARQVNGSHVEALGWDPHPLTADMLARSVPYEADTSRLCEVMQKAETSMQIIHLCYALLVPAYTSTALLPAPDKMGTDATTNLRTEQCQLKIS
jgi:hypothetical protein